MGRRNSLPDMRPATAGRFSTALATICLVGIPAAAGEEHKDVEIARLVSEAATCIFYPYFDALTPDEVFDENELATLSHYADQINVMIRAALGLGSSVCGAYFSQMFGLKENLDLLRIHVLKPDRFYGWEGLYSPDEGHQYADDQYVYSSKYMSAFESLAGKPVQDAIKLTDDEQAQIRQIAEDPDHESHEWALWILRKFAIAQDGVQNGAQE